MKMLIWGEHKCIVGDKYVVPEEYGEIEVVEIFREDKRKPTPHVIVRYNQGELKLIPGREFAYFVDIGFFSKIEPTKYRPGDRFVHDLDNSTIRIHQPLPRISENEQIYSVFIIHENEEDSVYVTIKESYLDGLLQLENEEDMNLPDISDVVLPRVRYKEFRGK